MTYSEAYKWVSRASTIDKEITVLTRKHFEAYDRATSITAQTEGVVTSATKDPHRKYDELAILSSEINARIGELNKTKAETIKVISELENPKHRMILLERFIPDESGNVKRVKDIASELHYDSRHVMRLQHKAIEALKDVIECHLY